MKRETKNKRYLIALIVPVLILLGLVASAVSPAIHSAGMTAGASPDDLEGNTRLAEGIGFSNPAATYCEEMGYQYKVVKTEDGETGIVTLPDGRECDAWAFYRGECGEEFSYCARKGWPVAPIAEADNFAGQCTTCILPGGSHETVSELLNLDAKSKLGTGILDGNTMIADMEADEAGSKLGDVSLPSHFDWRDNGGNWLTPVRDQSGCGSCWAFAAVGAVEAQFNIASGDPGLDLDLSEQYLVSDCCAYCGDCGGGWPYTALTFIRDEGITDEACFPYTASNGPCSDRCADWSSRLKYIDERGYVSSDVETIKGYLIEKGPLVVCLGVGSSYGAYWDNGIYRCTNDYGANHAVVLVGYDETQNYWIAKNSWGSGWNGDGYFKVGCGECSIENYVDYNIASSVLPTPTPTPMPTPTPTPSPTQTPTPTPMPTPTPAPAPDVYPCAYIGYAFVDNVAVPYGTGIRVLEDSTVLSEATTGEGTLADNQFYLDGVMAVPGTEVNFQILYDCGSEAQWLSADETATHEQYGRVEVNLHSGCPHDLTVLADPVEGGVATGRGTYDYCTNVAIDAYPADERWYFDHWTGEGIADPHSSSTTVYIDADKTVTAHFKKMQYELSVFADPAEGGVTTGSGTYDYRTNVAINAYPADERWHFDHWTGEGIADPHSTSTTAYIDADKTVSAMFVSVVDTIHIDTDPFLFCYPGVTCELPEALTNIGPDGLDMVTNIWGTVDGQWTSYDAEMGVGNLRELVNGNPYVMTHEDGVCNNWEFTPPPLPIPTPTPETIHIDADPFLFCYPGITCDLPEALTNIGPHGLDTVINIWGIVDGQWTSYDAEMGVGNLRELVNGNPYVMTHEDGVCNNWDMPQ